MRMLTVCFVKPSTRAARVKPPSRTTAAKRSMSDGAMGVIGFMHLARGDAHCHSKADKEFDAYALSFQRRSRMK